MDNQGIQPSIFRYMPFLSNHVIALSRKSVIKLHGPNVY